MTVPVFVDTNVLVYRHDAGNPAKRLRADAWYTLLWQQRSGRLSIQVLQELYSTLTRRLKPGVAVPKAQQIVRALAAWHPISIDVSTIERAWRIQERYLLSWWDSLIVAAAQSGNCRVLLTEDLQHGQLFGPMQVIDPFALPEWTPAEVLESLGS